MSRDSRRTSETSEPVLAKRPLNPPTLPIPDLNCYLVCLFQAPEVFEPSPGKGRAYNVYGVCIDDQSSHTKLVAKSREAALRARSAVQVNPPADEDKTRWNQLEID